MNPLATWVLGAVCAAGLTAGAVSVTAATSSTATPAPVQSGSSKVAHLKDVKHQLQRQLAAAAPTTTAPSAAVDAGARITPATWVQAAPSSDVSPAPTPTIEVPPTTTTTLPPATWVDDEGSAGEPDDAGRSTSAGEPEDD